MILAATGHRPDKLGGYEFEGRANLANFAFDQLIKLKPSKIITGMALGWDTAVAIAAYYSNIPFIAAVPFKGQEYKWPAENQYFYEELLNEAEEVKIICEGKYHPSKMQIRNEWMCNNCDQVLALWNGTTGGTKNCLTYAESINKPVINVWSAWEKHAWKKYS